MYSFYGGRPGNSFVITKTYTSKEDMLADFNSNNCQVHYDEYVLINNTDKLHEQHGNIYRRAYGIDENAAVLIGNIAGPPGSAPTIQFKDYDNSIFNDEDETNEGNFKLVSGQTNNEIKWKSITTKNEDNSDSTTYVGVEIPYPVFDFDVESVSPYSQYRDNNGNLVSTSIKDVATIEKISNDSETPFYQKWKFSIPRGISGNSIKEIQVIEDANNHHRYVYGTLIDYSQKEQGEQITERIGDLGFINEIESITRTGNEVSINLTNNQHFRFSVAPISSNVIQNFTYDKNTGKLEINDGQSHIVTIKSIKNVFIDSSGNVQIVYTNGDTDSNSNQLKLPKAFSMQGQNILVEWTNTTGKQIIGTIPNCVTNIKIDENNNHLLIKYLNNSNWVDLNPFTTTIEYEQGQLGPINWIGTGILNHISTDNNTLTFNVPLNKDISSTINNIIVTEGSIFSENNFITLQNLSSSQFPHIDIQKTNSGLTFIIRQLSDSQIFSNIQSNSELDQESTQIETGQHYINLSISNLILMLSTSRSERSLTSSIITDDVIGEEESMPDTSSETDETESQP